MLFIVDDHYTFFHRSRETFPQNKSTCFKSIKEIKQITPLSLSKKKKEKKSDEDYNKVTHTPNPQKKKKH